MAHSSISSSKRRFLAGLAALGLGPMIPAQAQTTEPARDCFANGTIKNGSFAVTLKAETDSTGNPKPPFFTTSLTAHPRMVTVAEGYIVKTDFSAFNPSESGHDLFLQDSQSLSKAEAEIEPLGGSALTIVNLKLQNVAPKPEAGYASQFLKSARIKLTTSDGAVFFNEVQDLRSLNLSTGERLFPLTLIPVTSANGIDAIGLQQWILSGPPVSSLRVELIDPATGKTLLTALYSRSDFTDILSDIRQSTVRLISDYDQRLCKSKVAGSPCFMTTAACSVIGLNDQCWELQALRNFRDEWLIQQPGGQRDISAYYDCAPRIISAVNVRHDADRVWLRHYWKHILPSAILAKLGAKCAARRLYTQMMSDMQRYLS